MGQAKSETQLILMGIFYYGYEALLKFTFMKKIVLEATQAVHPNLTDNSELHDYNSLHRKGAQ